MCDTPEPHVCYSCIRFEDGSGDIKPLCIGTIEECKKVQEMIPAVAYDGDRKPRDAFVGITTHKKWCKAWAHHEAQDALDEQKVGG